MTPVSTQDEACTLAHPTTSSFAAWMAGSAEGGQNAVKDANLSTADRSAQLTAVFQVFLNSQRYTPKKNLDSMLRSDPTCVGVEDHPLIGRDKRRLHVLQRELQRACLTATLLNLPVARRAGFILIDVLGFSEGEVAKILDTTPSAVHTGVGRARRELTSYLEPRCEHMDPANPCHCETRLGIALERGFITWPDRDDLDGDVPLVSRTICPDAERLYARLPGPLPSPRSPETTCR
ncbi:sigma factor-like helix-turn-helix DNA-binding protein [Nannocystis bainbridge]|uniref:Sigma factor-like helix-turn-helix DNA-binding protein n=1 Tax=Nannocystis bainbridge TaxID=2995303 RepID=A0ABT5E4Q2_9BACT|nr:sigma factor-like helix-turn-helix DNA-binding protein [Nannocystis bainbridge]MDC0720850.1 sigma factor-like helix-turn-helix DNA-binding protein [Nannocystis bainbridge]